MMTPDGIATILLAPVIGSFLATLVIRLPARRTLWGRSMCPHCGIVLSVADLIPLVSWIANRGRCRSCATRLSTLYPAMEIGAISVAAWAGMTLTGWELWAVCGLGWSLLTLAVIDVRHYLLPDVLTLPLIPAGLLVAWLHDPSVLRDALIGAAAGFVGFAFVAGVYRKLRRREGLGFGDVKLLAAAGAWTGWAALPSIVLIASVLALIITLARGALAGGLDTGREIPFGAYLGLSAWLVVLYGPLLL